MDFEDWIRAELSGARRAAAPSPAPPRWWRGLGTPFLVSLQLAASALAVMVVFSGAALSPRLEAIQLASLAPAPALPANTWQGTPPPPQATSGKSDVDDGPTAPAATPEVDQGRPQDHRDAGPAAPPPAASPTPAPPAPAQTSRTFVLMGGSATVACRGAAATLVSATPNPGYQAESESQDGGQTVEVRFRSSAHESRLQASCSGGSVQGQTEERSS